MYTFSALEALLQNGGDPFLKNKNGESIETYLQNRDDLQSLKALVEQARVSKNSSITGDNHFIHKAVENGSMKWLQFYAVFGGNFKSYNKTGECPLDIAIKKDNIDIVLYVISQSQELLENQDIFNHVFQFLETKFLDQKINRSQSQKYETLFKKLIRIATQNNKNVQVLLEMIRPESLSLSNDEDNNYLTISTQL